MPGFTAPKLLWVRLHEPKIFAATAKVLLPKDYVRLRMTGETASDMSDSSGTLWLDVAQRRWSDAMLAATGLDVSHMPKLFEGNEITGVLRAEIAEAWGMSQGTGRCRRRRQRCGSHRRRRGAAGRCVFIAGHFRGVVSRERWLPSESRRRGSHLLPCRARALASDVGDLERRKLRRLGRAALRTRGRGRGVRRGRGAQ